MHFFSQAFNYESVLSFPTLHQNLNRLFSHPWSHVVIGMWHKYPNPKCSHVVSIDVLDRSIDSKTGIIRTERVLGCKQKAPGWIVKVLVHIYLVEVIAYLPFLFQVIWRLGRCFCTGNLIRGSLHTKCYYHLRQPVAITICLMLRADTICSSI